MNGMRQGQNCPFTCAGEGKCKRKFRNGENWLKTPESKSSRASGLNFERLANLGSSRVRPAKIGLNFEISLNPQTFQIIIRRTQTLSLREIYFSLFLDFFLFPLQTN
jgi:hypothetical protein